MPTLFHAIPFEIKDTSQKYFKNVVPHLRFLFIMSANKKKALLISTTAGIITGVTESKMRYLPQHLRLVWIRS